VIEFDVIPTPVGPCTVQVERGRLIALSLGPAVIEAGRRRKLANIRRILADWFRGKKVDPPLTIEASGFTRRVYHVVQAIPRGKTRNYAEVARAAGSPGAARAVGNAMRRNPICLFIPCHRVVGTAGLGGFSSPGGLAQKQALLDLEQSR